MTKVVRGHFFRTQCILSSSMEILFHLSFVTNFIYLLHNVAKGYQRQKHCFTPILSKWWSHPCSEQSPRTGHAHYIERIADLQKWICMHTSPAVCIPLVWFGLGPMSKWRWKQLWYGADGKALLIVTGVCAIPCHVLELMFNRRRLDGFLASVIGKRQLISLLNIY